MPHHIGTFTVPRLKTRKPSSLDTQAMSTALWHASDSGRATVKFDKAVFEDSVVTHADRHDLLRRLLSDLASYYRLAVAIQISNGTTIDSYIGELSRADNDEGIEPVGEIDAANLVEDELDATLYDVEELPGEPTNPNIRVEEVKRRVA